jgi:hypothetical protein
LKSQSKSDVNFCNVFGKFGGGLKKKKEKSKYSNKKIPFSN